MTEKTEPVWQSTVDKGVWNAVVEDTTPGKGELVVSRIEDGKVILTEEVTLAYNAIFGPDVDDVRMWQVMTIEAIDHFVLQEAHAGDSGA